MLRKTKSSSASTEVSDMTKISFPGESGFKAEAEGLPYQTLAAMVLKKYVQGALLDRDAVREVVKALQTA